VEVGGAQAGLGYTGEWQAADVGLVYLRARWYQAETGRFTQVDPWEGDIWEPLSLNDYSYTRADPLNRVDPSGTMDMLTWYKAILPGVKFSSCSTNDYQPFAYLNIFMGHEEADTHYQLNQGATAQAWNQAPGGMLRALKRAVDGMVALLGPAFGRRMGEAINTHKVILVYDPLNGNPDELAYIYPPTANWAGVSVDSNRMNVNTAAGEFLGHAKFNPTPEDRMTAGFAHEFTHLVSRIVDGPEVGQAICASYCNQIPGYIDGWWVPYPAGSRGTACQQSTGAWSAPWEAVANLVGIYVAQPTIYDQPHPVLAPGKNIDLSYLRDFILQEFVPHMQ
jgi:RHS repeat-associated protein